MRRRKTYSIPSSALAAGSYPVSVAQYCAVAYEDREEDRRSMLPENASQIDQSEIFRRLALLFPSHHSTFPTLLEIQNEWCRDDRHTQHALHRILLGWNFPLRGRKDTRCPYFFFSSSSHMLSPTCLLPATGESLPTLFLHRPSS